MEEKNFLGLYESLREVPAEAQKPFDNGKFKGTDINPMWRIKRMTETFGPCGIGWYTEIVHRSLHQSTDEKTICAFIGLNLYVNVDGEWSKPIYGEGGNTMSSFNKKWSSIDTSDEAFKMAYTDAFSNATKQLGLGADIWFANDKSHSTKYDLQVERKNATKDTGTPVGEATKATPASAPAGPTEEEITKLFKTATTKAELRKLYEDNYKGSALAVKIATALSKTLTA